jgi:hypothetical protein
LQRAEETIVNHGRERQFDLFETPSIAAAIPSAIQQDLLELLAQMLEAIIFSAGNPTEDGHE